MKHLGDITKLHGTRKMRFLRCTRVGSPQYWASMSRQQTSAVPPLTIPAPATRPYHYLWFAMSKFIYNRNTWGTDWFKIQSVSSCSQQTSAVPPLTIPAPAHFREGGIGTSVSVNDSSTALKSSLSFEENAPLTFAFTMPASRSNRISTNKARGKIPVLSPFEERRIRGAEKSRDQEAFIRAFGRADDPFPTLLAGVVHMSFPCSAQHILIP